MTNIKRLRELLATECHCHSGGTCERCSSLQGDNFLDPLLDELERLRAEVPRVIWTKEALKRNICPKCGGSWFRSTSWAAAKTGDDDLHCSDQFSVGCNYEGPRKEWEHEPLPEVLERAEKINRGEL